VSQENVELVRSIHAAAGTDITSLFRDDAVFEQMRGFLEPVFAEDFVCSIVMPGEDRSASKSYEGPGGLRAAWLDWLEPWEAYRVAEHRFVDLGNRVLRLGRDRAVTAMSNAEVEVPSASIWTVRDGRIARAEFFPEPEQALRVAGIDDEARS
jgi:ketosteroid isomerase-like protein